MITLQFVLSKLEARVDIIGSNCLADKLHKEFYMLVIIFCAAIAGLILFVAIGMIVKRYAMKCRKSSAT